MKTITAIGIIAVLGLAVYFIYKATTTTKATSTTTIPQEYKLTYTPVVQPKKIVRFVPPPPPSVLPWAVKGYWEIGPEGSLLAPITPAMAFHYSAGIPSYVIAWYKQNYPQYSGEG